MSTEHKGDIWVIRIQGELTRNEEQPFFQVYPWLNQTEDTKYILFDMTGLQYINSAGISLLIRFVREAQQRQHSSFAFGVSPHYQKIFRIVGLTAYMELFPDEYSAMETLNARSSFEQ
ncbi:STAS domain-containing protein [Effusibacillus lacus]|uniref:Anti-anti-sigma factor n=1 Tax=Effusibacillus lacus TaxID=1348429 RepID=A0A292YMJ2_9BACL|nr:STAS domain-containing protein [Effusibacillus lacus]TCS76817.1 stage II sporulation protein AA (anti-sigma F factor antagonist) [Effusibacillus lacus]GAX91148.1 anti-anti-sigma factor [Effusibacillus lacus]